MPNAPLVCARCKVAVTVSAEAKPKDVVSCPQCGESDTLENVKRSLAEQAQEYAARMMQKSLRDASRGSKFFKYSPGVIPQRNHRFVIQQLGESHGR